MPLSHAASVGFFALGLGARRAKAQRLTQLPFSRSGDVVEYLLKSQWFVRCREMGDRAAKVRAQRREGRAWGGGAPRLGMKKQVPKRSSAVVAEGAQHGVGAAVPRGLAAPSLEPRVFSGSV